jgi:hypothetical protein
MDRVYRKYFLVAFIILVDGAIHEQFYLLEVVVAIFL